MPQRLRTVILKHLAATPQSGYGLTKSIHEATGWKPSYGSMYPQLEHLKEEGLVDFREEGKKKIYSLTKKGKEEVAEQEQSQDELLEQVQENMKLLTHMLGIESKAHDQMMDFLVTAVKRGDKPFKEIEESSTNMKLAFWKLYEEGKVKKNAKKINAILEEATKKLEKI